MMSFSKINNADFIGAIASILCMVHCIAEPFLIAFGAVFITNPIFKYLFVIISFTSIFRTTKNTENTKIALLLWISFWGLLLSVSFQEELHWLHYTGYFFSMLIITGHILNIKFCKYCSDDNYKENEK